MSRKNYFDEDENFMEYESGEEDYDGEEGEYMPEAKAYERVMYNLPSAVAAIQGPKLAGKMGDIQRKLNKIDLQPRERFILQVNAIYNNLTENGIISLVDGEIDAILDRAEYIPNIQYKNPTAYILGYMANAGSARNKLNRKNVENILRNVLPKIPADAGITEPDVIRYARLWQLS